MAAEGRPAPSSRPPAATPADRAIILERLGAQFPRWLLWHDGRRWHARRRGSFLATGDGAAYHVSDPDLHFFRVALAAEDAAPVTGAQWDLA